MTEEAILLTGLPSFRARAMLRELFSRPQPVRVFAPVAEEFASEARRFIDQLPLEQRSAVELLDGSATSMDLGLSGKEYLHLASRVRRVHHLAHLTAPDARRSDVEHANIVGTREVLEFGRAASSVEAVVIHSSARVAGDRVGVVFEDELNMGQAFGTPVEESLARAERLVRGAMGEVPLVVVRPTLIVGDSQTGEVDPADVGYLFLLLLLGSNRDLARLTRGRTDFPVNVVPVDFVMRAAARVAEQRDAVGRTFHVRDSEPSSLHTLFERVARGVPGVSRGRVSSRLGQRLGGDSPVRSGPRALLGRLSVGARFDSRNTDELLRGSGIACPKVETYIERVATFVAGHSRALAPGLEESQFDDPLG